MTRTAWAALAILTGAASAAGDGEGEIRLTVEAGVTVSVSGGNDVARLKHLASGIGWEFEPNAATTGALKQIGIRSVRCINVDPLPGEFDADGTFRIGAPDRLDAHLRTCREIGARPHIILATGLHESLRLTADDVKDRPGLMGLVPTGTFGPNDRGRFREYCRAYFEYVLVTRGFPDACFEIGNEPDIGGTVCPLPPKPGNGTAELYAGYFALFKDIYRAARDFEREHPDLEVRVGGPALAWAFTFRYGDFNWAERFIRDCAEAGMAPDFIGVHFYGNISSVAGSYESNYPSFREMLARTRGWCDRYLPGTPIRITEWGASYHTSNDPQAAVNADARGAVWAAGFLDMMLEERVDEALYLVTTDLRRPVPETPGTYENVWGWPSLFVNPHVYGHAYPKAPFHLFDMIARLRGSRVRVVGEERGVRCFAAADPATRSVMLLVRNSDLRIPEFGDAEERAGSETVTVRIDGASLPAPEAVRARRFEVAPGVGDAHGLHAAGAALSEAGTALRESAVDVRRDAAGGVTVRFDMVPSGLSLILVEGSADAAP